MAGPTNLDLNLDDDPGDDGAQCCGNSNPALLQALEKLLHAFKAGTFRGAGYRSMVHIGRLYGLSQAMDLTGSWPDAATRAAYKGRIGDQLVRAYLQCPI
jgi:hypothetical protein